MNAGCAPGRVFGNHAEDELAQLRADAFSSWTRVVPREPSPIRFESSVMPSHNRLRLDNNQCLLPPAPEEPQEYPEQSARSRKVWLRMFLLQDRKLLPKRQILQEQVAPRTTKDNYQSKYSPQQTQHMPNFT